MPLVRRTRSYFRWVLMPVPPSLIPPVAFHPDYHMHMAYMRTDHHDNGLRLEHGSSRDSSPWVFLRPSRPIHDEGQRQLKTRQQ